MKIRVLIVDDSSFFRKRLTAMMTADPQIEVVGIAENGRQAIDMTQRLKPDIITMDLEMPVMDGITATRAIMAKQPTPILMLSSWTTEGAKQTLDALEAGAVDFLPKRFENLANNRETAQQLFCKRLRQVAKNIRSDFENVAAAPIVRNSSQHTTPAKRDQQHTTAPRLVVIGSSTGGPVAVQTILSQLPVNFACPILLVQHMPAEFTPSFAQRLNAQCKVAVKHAADGDLLSARTAYLAPGGYQILVNGKKERAKLSIKQSETKQIYKPCIDITLSSLATIGHDEVLTIILTGMGSDGREGCRALHKLGNKIWSQDQQSSTIPGMPMAVINAGLANEIISLNDIAPRLIKRVMGTQ